jgi:steroid delta-isomerase-like uncharacterized protein
MRSRALLAALAIAGAMIAPSVAAQDATPATGCVDRDVETMSAMAEAWTDNTFVTSDTSDFLAMLSPDLVYHSGAFDDMDLSGWQEARKGLTGAFADGKIDVNITIVDAPFAVTQWTVTGTSTGEFMGTPATGEPVSWDGINLYRFDCGTIAEAWTELDQFGRFDPVGAPATPVAPTCEAGTSEADVEQLLRAWWDKGWNGTDAAAIADVTSEDVFHSWASGPDTVGDDDISGRIAQWKTAMPDLSIEPGEILIDGDYAAARWTASGTDTGGVMGAPATGKRATWDGINVFRVSCGEIVAIWSEMDAQGMMEQLGS